MTAHASRLSGPIRRPAGRRPAPRATRIVRAVLLVAAFAVVAASLWALADSPRLAGAAARVCTAGEPAGTSCVDALYRTGYPA